MKKLGAFLQKTENIIIIVTFSVMVIAIFVQVLNRNFFKRGIGWFEELAVYCMIWMTLLSAEMGLRDGSQMSITMLATKLTGKARALLLIVIKIIVVIFTLSMTRFAIGMVAKQIQTGQLSAGLRISMAVPYSALVAGFGIMTIVQGISLVLMLIRFFHDGKKEIGA